jgi:heme o synthase
MSTLTWQQTSSRFAQFLALAKPRVVSLIVFCAVIGMLLAVPPGALDARFALTALVAALGIALVAGAAAAFNCLVEYKIDALMARTRGRPLPRGELTPPQTMAFATIVGSCGLALLYFEVNALTMWLTLATFVGYAVIYTVVLKPMTPQNIVIGGASGAMPPVLGWAAMTGDVSFQALLLFLIIFAWTPPHFWALALYRKHEYAKAGVPMLPVTHGDKFTRLHVLLYTVILVAVTLLPFATRMSGLIYVASAAVLGAIFLHYAIQVYRNYSDTVARATFRYSILYLTLLFAALLLEAARGRGVTVRGAPRRLRARKPAAGVSADRRHRRRVCARLSVDRPPRQDSNAGRLQGQGGGGVFRVYTLPGCVSGHLGRTRRGDERTGRRCRPRAGAVCDRRSGTRYADIACAICACVSSAISWLVR